MSTGMETIDLGTDDRNVVAIKITGEFTGEAMQEFIARIEAIRGAGNKALVYIDLLGYEGQELAVAKNKLANISTLWNVAAHWGEVRSDDQLRTVAAFLKERFLDRGLQGMMGGEGFYTYPNPAYEAAGFLDVPDAGVVSKIVEATLLS